MIKLETALEVSDLTKRFGEKAAVDGISFAVKKGEIMGLLGPNGAGKTTAIRMIMGILQPDRGSTNFYFNGRATSVTPLIKNRIGYLPEERGLYDDATVINNLVYLAELKETPRRKARELAVQWLERFDLADYANQKLEKLSKGMQQKVQFIATILHQPDLIMLDEPFSGLDPINQDFFKELIRELQRQETTILLSAHQMNLVEELCETIFMINNGRQVLYGPWKKIKKEHTEYNIELGFDEGEEITFLKQEPGVSFLKEEAGRIVFRYEGTKMVNELLQQLTARLNLLEVSVKKPPLHDIFVQTVKKRGEAIEDPGFF